jgi:hypothetical protein
MTTKAKMPKIKIPEQDLKSFIKESLKVDPFWYDLYGIENEKVKEKSKE